MENQQNEENKNTNTMDNQITNEIEKTNINSTVELSNNNETKPLDHLVPNNGIIRENFVMTAVNFLQNERVQNSPLSQKRTFLLKKGLTNDEIDLAIERSSMNHVSQPFKPSNRRYDPQISPPIPPQYVFPPAPSLLIRTTNLASSLAIITGFVYSAYVLYKRYIEPKLFGHNVQQKHPFVIINERLEQLTEAIALLKTDMTTIELNLKRQIEQEMAALRPASNNVSLHELKTELSSIKGLLLSRRQFAATPVPTIPSWQLEDKNNTITNEITNKHEQSFVPNGVSMESDGSSIHDDENGIDSNVTVKLTEPKEFAETENSDVKVQE